MPEAQVKRGSRPPHPPARLSRLLALIAMAAVGLDQARAGVRLLTPGEEMAPLDGLPQLIEDTRGAGPPVKIGPVRVAVAGGDAALLAGVAPQAAPFEVVAAGDGPDLVWDSGARQAISKGEVVAYGIAAADLPAVVDRMAFAEAVAKLAAARPQPIRIAAGSQPRRRGESVAIEIPDVQNRALILFSVSGDGVVQALYPRGADPAVVAAASFAYALEIHEPFGADLIVAVTAAQPMDALADAVRLLSRHRGAGEALTLLARLAPPDARIGVAAMLSAP